MIQKRFSLLLIWILVSFAGQAQGESTSPYSFDKNGIQKEVLKNYLDRSITVTNLLVPNQGEEQLNDDIRMIQNIGAKFLGRSILLWENEQILKDPTFWKKAEQIIQRMHADDPDLVFQACLFEAISTEVSQIEIPEWVFDSYGLKPEKRNFRYEDMLNLQGKYVDHWHTGGSVPDISRQETQLWFYFLACSYIRIGCEAFHLGQIELMGMNDPEHTGLH